MYQDFNCPEKERVNNKIRDLVTDIFKNKAKKALILDGPSMTTFNTLKQVMDPKNITIIERNCSTVQQQQKHVHGNVFYGSVANYLDNSTSNANIFFLDWMGSIFGNRSTGDFPLESMLRILKTSPHRQLIFAATFCNRGVTAVEGESYFETCRDELEKALFRDAQYRVKESSTMTYKRNGSGAHMVFFLYVLKKSTNIDRSLCEYMLTEDRK